MQILVVLHPGQSNKYTVASHCAFNLHFSDYQWYEQVFMCLLATFKSFFVYYLFIYLYKFFTWSMCCQYFLPVWGLHFLSPFFIKISLMYDLMHFLSLNRIFWRIKVPHFSEVQVNKYYLCFMLFVWYLRYFWLLQGHKAYCFCFHLKMLWF